MIYITGDTHGNFTKFDISQFPIQDKMTKKDYLTDYLQEISEKCEFNKWYFGHYHENRQVNSQFVLLYEDIVPLKYESIF